MEAHDKDRLLIGQVNILSDWDEKAVDNMKM